MPARKRSSYRRTPADASPCGSDVTASRRSRLAGRQPAASDGDAAAAGGRSTAAWAPLVPLVGH
nr:unnamed protein product [Digitaria exilis]